ncbi:hypothetical protein [Frankia sp. CiP3]|uniref:hypothetical protein n=1 Tax=Frankia sp. CiP3 TaxID=2880971 RepID=UPI001EF5A593|nr:hypothetical protein [Frankia sp. CiP3]
MTIAVALLDAELVVTDVETVAIGVESVTEEVVLTVVLSFCSSSRGPGNATAYAGAGMTATSIFNVDIPATSSPPRRCGIDPSAGWRTQSPVSTIAGVPALKPYSPETTKPSVVMTARCSGATTSTPSRVRSWLANELPIVPDPVKQDTRTIGRLFQSGSPRTRSANCVAVRTSEPALIPSAVPWATIAIHFEESFNPWAARKTSGSSFTSVNDHPAGILRIPAPFPAGKNDESIAMLDASVVVVISCGRC